MVVTVVTLVIVTCLFGWATERPECAAPGPSAGAALGPVYVDLSLPFPLPLPHFHSPF